MFKFVDLPVEIPNLESIDKDGKRYYPVPSGKFYPSITTVTSFKKAHVINEWRQRVGEEFANRKTARATGRGTAFHSIVEHYLKNEHISTDTFGPLPLTLFQVAKPILNRINNIHLLEGALYSDYLRVAGRVDCIAEFDGELSVIDFKTSDKDKKEEWIENYFVQATAYAVMFYELTGIQPKKIVIIIATEEGHCQVIVKTNLDYYFTLLKEYINAFTRGQVDGE
jgi:ATP-dependent exoDNAse (exonuclease V) beta subunit